MAIIIYTVGSRTTYLFTLRMEMCRDVREIVTRTLAEELDRVSAPRQIDYLSLDTEGNP